MTISSVSMVNILNPALVNNEPMSLTSVNGEMCGETPPFLSNSANCKEDLNSYRVSPPKTEANNTPSSFKLFNMLLNAVGKSFTQCRFKLDITKSNEFGSN